MDEHERYLCKYEVSIKTAVDIFKWISQHHQWNLINLHYVKVEAEISEMDK